MRSSTHGHVQRTSARTDLAKTWNSPTTPASRRTTRSVQRCPCRVSQPLQRHVIEIEVFGRVVLLEDASQRGSDALAAPLGEGILQRLNEMSVRNRRAKSFIQDSRVRRSVAQLFVPQRLGDRGELVNVRGEKETSAEVRSGPRAARRNEAALFRFSGNFEPRHAQKNSGRSSSSTVWKVASWSQSRK